MTIITAEFKCKKQKLHFRDSMQFLAMALAKMPEAFELSGEVKGFLPHLYNHPDNYRSHNYSVDGYNKNTIEVFEDYDSRGRAGIGLEWEKDWKAVLSAYHISELDEPSEPKPIETNGFKRVFSLESIDLYFEDRVMGTKWIVDYVADLFNLNVHSLVIDRNGIWAIDWINNRQEKMLECFKFDKNPKYHLNAEKDLNYVLRNARASDYFVLNDMFPVNYRFDGILGPVNHLLISHGHWVTLDNLMTFDFIKIKVRGSRISVTDLHSFLRHWRAGGSHQMTYLGLQLETYRNFERLEEELEIIEDRLRNGDERNGDYSITRNDGVKAVMRFGTQSFVMTVLPPREII
ncbi:hypothetical protein B9Z55_015433 [Caenorhabditis nigoni]|nr:hypothetical protein B9Z55_015433 [Caenorhabditis nigoni]